ncbi:MAG: hypothetical protein FRX48_06727 [Lasallia pustulata]|uniref:Uncharacterized protein n=1 Tax=Lasallia pustulata TaxID=136370 RepID=A0A5M8PKP6_9LECA|nr:MAG: hypothetical protein FRX48_06727 [Lasallia pustulata]
MVHLSYIVQAVALLLFVPTALADVLNRTLCYCGTPVGELDATIEAGCFYFYQYHSNPYNMNLNIDYTCRGQNFDNACTERFAQRQQRCRTFDEGWEFCYRQRGRHSDEYAFMGIRHPVGGLVVTPPKEEVDMVCDHLCMKHVGLPRIPAPWDISNKMGRVIEWRGASKIEIFPELPDIVLPKRGFPFMAKPGSDGQTHPTN